MITPEQLAKSGTEHGHQAALFCWAALPEIRIKHSQLKYMYAIPNGFFGSAAQKAKMKAEGLKSGVPDICLPVTRQHFITGNPVTAGLYIELKIGKNKPSDEQIDWIKFLLAQKYSCHVCYGWEEARDRIVEYLGGMIYAL